MILFLISVFSFLIFLFTLFTFSKDDFVFLRKNLTVETMFNLVFLALPVSIVFARLLYVAAHPSIHFLNPLVFFLIPYFPGVSLAGGFLGGLLFIWWYCAYHHLPGKRILDVCMIAFLLGASIYALSYSIFLFILRSPLTLLSIGVVIGLLIISWLFIAVFQRGVWKDGMVGFTSLLFSLLIFLGFSTFGTIILSHTFLSLENIFLATLTLISLFLVLRFR